MKSAVIVFPGSNCDRDIAVALEVVTGRKPTMVWHGDTDLPADTGLIALPGGFSYGDYLRCGAIAARSAIVPAVIAAAERGVPVLGICNGFQILCESGLLPGVLMRNVGRRFLCHRQTLRVERTDTAFTRAYSQHQVIDVCIAHGEGNYFADPETLARIEGEGRVAFRYCDEAGQITVEANRNGSLNAIAGIYSETRNVLGMMPHPENFVEGLVGGTDGRGLFESLAKAA